MEFYPKLLKKYRKWRMQREIGCGEGKREVWQIDGWIDMKSVDGQCKIFRMKYINNWSKVGNPSFSLPLSPFQSEGKKEMTIPLLLKQETECNLIEIYTKVI